MVTKYVDVEVKVDVDLSDFETEELIEELDERGFYQRYKIDSIVESIYNHKRNNRSYDKELSELIYNVLGRIC